MSVKDAILNSLMCLTALAFSLQCVIDPSAENIASACIVLVSSLSLLAYIKWWGAADAQPLSTVAIFGFCITTQLGALLVQTAFWTPLRLSLYNSLLTFGTLAFYQSIAIAAHMVYRYFSDPDPERVGIFRSVFTWAGVYRIPPSQVLWAMGGLGVMSFLAARFGGVAARVASAFQFFAWAPFLLPLFLREVGPAYCRARLNKIALLVYAGVVVLMGIALNVRVVMFIGLVTVSLLYLLIGMRSRAPLRQKSVGQLAVVAVILAALSVPLADLATSMAIARGARGKVSPVEMVQRTLAVWRRPALIAEYRKEASAVSRFAAYDEHYIANPLLARFVETKFHDNSFHFAGAMTSESARDHLRKVTIDTTWAALPTPILRFLHIHVNKEDMEYSMGDYMAYLSRGVPLGGFKTGSMFAQGQVILGPLFPMLYLAICLLFYGFMDLLTIRNPLGSADLSALAMMTLWNYFYRGITSDAVSNAFVFIVRDFAQTVLIYVTVLAVARYMLSGREPHPASSADLGWRRAI